MTQRTSSHSGNIGFVSLGCAKATVDSERILTALRTQNYQMVGEFNQADLVIVNTCGFIDDAVAESLDTIAEAMDENGKVIVTGCLGAKGNIVSERFPNLLAITGPQQTASVMATVNEHLPPRHDPYLDVVPPGGIKLTPRHYAYLKIAEGCNQTCSFCIIPSMRGKLVSRSAPAILSEAEALVSAGVRELLVVSQDTSAYGVDTKYANGFHGMQPVRNHIVDLSKALGALGVWVRLHYVYPYPHVDNLIPLMADGLILPYLDIPFQHASRPILKAMRRPAHSEKVLERLTKWRQQCPELTIRSTFIVGFPGETEEDFNTLLEFLDSAQIDRAGCFTYSDVSGASANDLPGHLPESEKQARYEAFMAKQQAISQAKLQQKIGSQQEVIIDEVGEDFMIGRSKADSPEVDGLVHFREAAEVQQGDIIYADIIAATEHDLIGQVVFED